MTLTQPAPDRRSPLDRDSVVEEMRRVQLRLQQLERNQVRGLTVTPDGTLIVPKISLGGRDNGSGSSPDLIGDYPGEPTGVTVTSDGDEDSTWLDVSWSYPTGVGGIQQSIAGFEVRHSRGNETDWVYVDTTGTTQRIDNIVAGVDYYVQVRSFSTVGVRDANGWVNAVPYPLSGVADSVPPAMPTGVSPAGGYRAVGASWNDNTERDLAGYDWRIATDVGMANVIAEGSLAGTVMSVAELPDTGGLYYFQVRARDFSGNVSAYSPALAAVTDLIPNAHIIELTVDKLRAGTVGAEVITLTNSSNSRIQSFDGTSMVIRGDGYARFANVEIVGGSLTIGTRASITSNGTATFDFMTATNASVTGTFRTGAAGDFVLINAGGNSIELYDNGSLRGALEFFASGGVQLRGPQTNDGVYIVDDGASITAQNGVAYVGTAGGSSLASTGVEIESLSGGVSIAAARDLPRVNNEVRIGAAGDVVFQPQNGGTGIKIQQVGARDIVAGRDGNEQIEFDSGNESARIIWFDATYNFRFQNDRNVVLTDGGAPVWDTGTGVSDRREKQLGAELTETEAWEIIDAMTAWHYRWSDELLAAGWDDSERVGLIAQDAVEVLPQAVSQPGLNVLPGEEPSDRMLLAKDEFVPVIITALQSLRPQATRKKARR